ncbi:MAG: hypothetical protein ACREBR_01135 [bacterium]
MWFTLPPGVVADSVGAITALLLAGVAPPELGAVRVTMVNDKPPFDYRRMKAVWCSKLVVMETLQLVYELNIRVCFVVSRQRTT